MVVYLGVQKQHHTWLLLGWVHFESLYQDKHLQLFVVVAAAAVTEVAIQTCSVTRSMVVALVLGCVANLLETQLDQPSVAQAESWDQHIAFPELVAAEPHSEPRQQVAYLWLNQHSL